MEVPKHVSKSWVAAQKLSSGCACHLDIEPNKLWSRTESCVQEVIALAAASAMASGRTMIRACDTKRAENAIRNRASEVRAPCHVLSEVGVLLGLGGASMAAHKRTFVRRDDIDAAASVIAKF